MLSAPLSVAVIVLVQMLYVQDLVGDDVHVLGEEEEKGKKGEGESGDDGAGGEGG
jgi:hypothetical protein